MSVPYKIEANEEYLIGGRKRAQRASERIPQLARVHVSDRAKKALDLVCRQSRTVVIDTY